MNDFKAILENNKFDEQLKKIVSKYKNKKIVLYGAGIFCDVIRNNYDLTALNIIAVSDIKYNQYDKPASNIDSKFDVIAPEFIHRLKPDIVLITIFDDYIAEWFFNENLFKKTKKKFAYVAIFQPKFSEKIRNEWEKYF